MKVKIAGKLYNVVKIKKSLGITHYCIEDEPNHYDWVNNVEVIEDSEIKEGGEKMSIIDALKEKPEALVKVGISRKYLQQEYSLLKHYSEISLAQDLANYMLKNRLIKFTKNEEDDIITLDAYFYMINTDILKKGGEE